MLGALFALLTPLRVLYGAVVSIIALTAVVGKLPPSFRPPGLPFGPGGNSTPVVDTVTVAVTSYGRATNPITIPLQGGHVYIHGSVSDEDGCAELRAPGYLRVDFYPSDAGSCQSGGSTCVSSGASAATIDACSTGGTTARYQAVVFVPPASSPNARGSSSASEQWTAEVTVSDVHGASASNREEVTLRYLAGPTSPAPAVPMPLIPPSETSPPLTPPFTVSAPSASEVPRSPSAGTEGFSPQSVAAPPAAAPLTLPVPPPSNPFTPGFGAYSP